MTIYELSIDGDNATSLDFPIQDEQEQFLLLAEEKITNNLSVKAQWQEFLVLKKEPKIDMDFNDINDMGVYIISPRAYELLYPLFDDSVEVLPLKSDDGTYFLLNIIQTTDCLDKENSVYTALPGGQILEYENLSIDPQKITCPLFRIPELPYTVLITDQIQDIFYLHQLKGLHFTENEFVTSDF
ncbi:MULTISPECIES: DUF1629 domain-containing protein [unclassified Gilliamella]|uniref:imm11 family protein n=1 Tax=unclassified Gilliamella TaxID=2685620 RepID=UPI0013062F80|nr:MULTISPECIES: DUF1629 domain-containing protein [unclassified Gilliamella]MWP49541.1 hypothetical protein [Gilliamella sp. Lep-s35]MWP69179.1 hypothetical protein [Gilliamella sp. Lep-s5]MWP77532.1 hypothetical protein [Gilliamella sp. Lep-s21]